MAFEDLLALAQLNKMQDDSTNEGTNVPGERKDFNKSVKRATKSAVRRVKQYKECPDCVWMIPEKCFIDHECGD